MEEGVEDSVAIEELVVDDLCTTDLNHDELRILRVLLRDDRPLDPDHIFLA